MEWCWFAFSQISIYQKHWRKTRCGVIARRGFIITIINCLGLVMSSIVDAYKTGLVHIILSFLYCAGVEFTTPKGTKDFVVSAVFLTIMDLVEASQLMFLALLHWFHWEMSVLNGLSMQPHLLENVFLLLSWYKLLRLESYSESDLKELENAGKWYKFEAFVLTLLKGTWSTHSAIWNNFRRARWNLSSSVISRNIQCPFWRPSSILFCRAIWARTCLLCEASICKF